MYAGMAVSVDFIKVIRPASERHFDFHPASRCSTLDSTP